MPFPTPTSVHNIVRPAESYDALPVVSSFSQITRDVGPEAVTRLEIGSGCRKVDSALPSDGSSSRPSPATSAVPGQEEAVSTAPPRKTVTRPVRKDTATGSAPGTKDVHDGSSTITPTASTPVDPLTQRISVRTKIERSGTARLRNPANLNRPERSDKADRADSPANDGGPPGLGVDPTTPTLNAPVQTEYLPRKEKKKGPGFLGRLSMIGNKKRGDDISDDDSEISELRTEGANAVAFAQPAAAVGYLPHHKEPPRYIRVRSHSKKAKEFDRIFLAQVLWGRPGTAHDVDRPALAGGKPDDLGPAKAFERGEADASGPIWAVEFSRDGKYLATAGRDRIVRVWAVISSPAERRAYEETEKETTADTNGERLSAPVFLTDPVREFSAHTGEVLDLSWSKNNFLLSSSVDKTVRLWHVSRPECLCTFKHQDFVTSIAFHPQDDRFFLAGSLDAVLRLWSIPDKAVAFSVQLSDLITAVAFSPDGKTSMAGCLHGQCLFHETEGLKFQSQIHVRSSRGKNAKGSKITGIQAMSIPPGSDDGDVKVLVTSNDSRIRIYNLPDKKLDTKFKGHRNACSQIRASFNDDGRHIICGSEDKRAFVWPTGPPQSEREVLKDKDKRTCEYFEAHSDVVTQAVFAPTSSKVLLQRSGDPLFTLCNPPPVTLMSKDEVGTNTAAAAPVDVPVGVSKPEESPAYIARSRHPGGNIVVTTDHEGLIKVFRQDCAFAKRRLESLWETGSTLSRKLGRDGLLGRTGSIMTRHSAGSARDASSRRNSVSRTRATASPQLKEAAIMSWRQDIVGHRPSRSTSRSVKRPSSMAVATPAKSDSSGSPPPNLRASATAALASAARRRPYAHPRISPMSPSWSAMGIHPGKGKEGSNAPTEEDCRHTTFATSGSLSRRHRSQAEGGQISPQPPTPSFSYITADEEKDELREDPAGASYSFWSLNRWKNFASPKRASNAAALMQAKDRAHVSGHGMTTPAADPATEDKRRKSMGVSPSSTMGQEKVSAEMHSYHSRRRSLQVSAVSRAARMDIGTNDDSLPLATRSRKGDNANSAPPIAPT